MAAFVRHRPATGRQACAVGWWVAALLRGARAVGLHSRAPDHRRRRAAASAVIALAAAGGLLAVAPVASAVHGRCADATRPVSAADHAAMQRAVVCLVNRERTERGLPPLVPSRKLDRSAQGWTDAMVDSGRLSHGAAFPRRISAVGFDWSTVGENIATGYPSPQAVVQAWMHSPGHCANILSPAYREVGTGAADRPIPGASNIDGTWTQDFGRLMSQPAPSHDGAPAAACYRR